MSFNLRCFLLLFILSSIPQIGLFSQNNKDTVAKVITISNSRISDCVVTNKFIWILDENGTIKRINPNTYNTIDSLNFKNRITSIANSPSDTVFVADETGTVFRIYNSGDTNTLWQTNQSVQKILFGPDKRCFLITDKGIYEPEWTRHLFFDNDFSNPFAFRHNLWRFHPSATFMDSKGFIWLGFDSGEWGGDILLFSTNKFQFVKFRDKYKPNCYVQPVRAIFEIDSVMYITTSLQHFGVDGSILKVKDSCSYLFSSPDGEDGSLNKFDSSELYLGPSIYNKADSSIYFYCQFGIFKGNVKNDLSKIANWSRVLDTRFMWYYGMPNAVGYGMNVSKMFFEKNKLFIISPNNGVMIWNGHQKTLLKTTFKPKD